MNDPKETQEEFFPEFSAAPKKPERFPSAARAHKPILFSTNTEQLLMAGIVSILVLCGVFFLGVIRGKALQGQPITEIPSRTAVPAEARPSASAAMAPKPRAAAPLPAPGTVKAAPAKTVPVPARPAAVVPAAEIASKPYTLQIVTHRKKEFAEAEMNALRAQGFYSFIIPSGEYFQVCAGQYATKEEAKRDLARFSAKYKDCFLRRR